MDQWEGSDANDSQDVARAHYPPNAKAVVPAENEWASDAEWTGGLTRNDVLARPHRALDTPPTIADHVAQAAICQLTSSAQVTVYRIASVH